jgi:heme/copper-type cytochrome/quinol oxidase subunit 4
MRGFLMRIGLSVLLAVIALSACYWLALPPASSFQAVRDVLVVCVGVAALGFFLIGTEINLGFASPRLRVFSSYIIGVSVVLTSLWVFVSVGIRGQ